MNQETEELFQKWLKLEIAKTQWGFVVRVVTLLLLAIGVIVSARIVEPIVTRQLQFLDAMQKSIIKSSGTQLKDEQMQQMLQESQ